MRSRTVASNWRGITGSISPTDTARTRSGSTAATVRRIHSAIRRFEFEHSRLDTCLALAGCHRERPLPWRQPGHGVAARRFGWIDGEESAGPGGGALAAHGRPSARDAARDPALRAARCRRRMAAHDTDRRQPARHRLRSLPACQPAPSESPGTDLAGAIRALVVRGRTRAWRRTNAGADLSRALPG